jgi:hypothetical protein
MSITVSADDAFLDFTKRLGILASGDFSATPEMFERIVQDNVQGSAIDTHNTVNEIFLKNVSLYVMDTNQSLLYNDVTNANEFLRDTMTKEIDKYATMRDRTFNTIHKTRHSYMAKKYAMNYNRFLTVLIQFTIFITVLVALVFGLHKMYDYYSLNTAIYIAAPIVLVYLLIVLLFYKQNQVRRRDDWNKFYFTSSQDKASGSCA